MLLSSPINTALIVQSYLANAGDAIPAPATISEAGDTITHVPPYASHIGCEYFNLAPLGSIDTFDFPSEALAILAEHNNPEHCVITYQYNPNYCGTDPYTVTVYTSPNLPR